MKKKQCLLLSIILLPSALWLILETSTINSKRLPIYGPKKIISANDTIFYQTPNSFFSYTKTDSLNSIIDTIQIEEFPLYVISFLKTKYDNESYRIAGLWEYLNYKKNKIEHIPVFLVAQFEKGQSKVFNDLKTLNKNSNVYFKSNGVLNFDSLNHLYFNKKPYYVDYSFFVLVDAKRQIRGYYDGRYVAEIKRMIDEYQHLRLKEEKQRLIDKNEIKKNR